MPLEQQVSQILTNSPQKRKHNPRPGKTPAATELRGRAHARLEELLDHAEATRFYGLVGVTVSFENGHPTTVRRTLEGTDKQA